MLLCGRQEEIKTDTVTETETERKRERVKEQERQCIFLQINPTATGQCQPSQRKEKNLITAHVLALWPWEAPQVHFSPCQPTKWPQWSNTIYIKQSSPSYSFFFLKDFINLRERERENTVSWEGQRVREKQTLAEHGGPTCDSISGPWDHDLSGRPMLKGLSPPGAPPRIILEQHHQCTDKYVLDVLLDIPKKSSIWARFRQNIKDKDDQCVAKVSLPVLAQGTSVAFSVSLIKYSWKAYNILYVGKLKIIKHWLNK